MSTHIFFNSVFTDTHSELTDLKEAFAELKKNYQSNSYIKEKKNETIVLIEGEGEGEGGEEEEEEESNDETEILSKEQIEKFKDIYNKNKIVDDEFIISDEQEEMDHDINHYVENLLNENCCLEECLKEKLNFNDIKTRYKSFLDLRKTEQDSFLKGILSASLRGKETYKGEKRRRLANVYYFDGIEICKTAFKGIYGIGEKRWKNIRSHFVNFDIQLRTNLLTGKVSNRAVSFDGVLQTIKFILNYSNINGLPSPGKYRFLINI